MKLPFLPKKNEKKVTAIFSLHKRDNMTDIDKPGLFALLCICVFMFHCVFLALNIHYQSENDLWMRKAHHLFAAGLLGWSQVAWIVYIFLWDDWVKALTWDLQTFHVTSIDTIPHVVVAPILSYTNSHSGAVYSFAWVLKAKNVAEFNALINIYQPGYMFVAYQSPEKATEIQKLRDENQAALAVFITLVFICFFIWGFMIYTWRKTCQPLPPAYSEPEHSPPPSYCDEPTQMEDSPQTIVSMIEENVL